MVVLLGIICNLFRLWITFGLLAVAFCSVYRLKSESHGEIGEEYLKGINLPAEFVESRQKRDVEKSSVAQKVASEFEFKKDSDRVGFIHWSGKESKIVLFFTCGRANKTKDGQFFCDTIKLWRSADYGQSFVFENAKFNGIIISGVEVCASDHNKVILSSVKNKTLFVSQDEGETYTSYATPFRPYVISCNPGKQTDLLVAYDVDTSKLYFSEKYGQAFGGALSIDVNKFFWDQAVDGPPAIYLEVKTNKNIYLSVLKKVVLKSGVASGDVAIFDNDLGNFTTDSLQIEGNYIFVKKHVPSIKLYVYSMLHTTFFYCANFPLDAAEKDYIVVDASEDEVLVAVRHENTTNLYVSENTGSKYSLSLENIAAVRINRYNQYMYAVDIHRVKSMRGTYLANTVKGNMMRTVITYNKGGKWNDITAPKVDQHNKPVDCKPPKCSLHLHMALSRLFTYIPPVLSSSSAVGLIVAQGNIGSGLSAGIGLFFSRDGGITWYKAFDDLFDFAIGDHGGIIVAVPMTQNATTLWYSCTEGISWQNVTFGKKPIHVFAIMTEPGDATLVFNVFGHYSHGPSFQWLAVKVDFNSVLTTMCKPKDYVMWSPSDQYPDIKCLLGEQTVFERRKADSCCFNGGNYSREINVTSCACGVEDFQCDVGFIHAGVHEVCFVTDEAKLVPLECPEGKTYQHSNGYRKVPGDKCRGGIEDQLKPEERSCPITTPQSLAIKTSHTTVAAGGNVDFELVQLKGSKVSTLYLWDFNDGTPTVKITGLKSAKLQTHVFKHHGQFNLSVTASNKAGQSRVKIHVNVLDSIDRLKIEPAHGVVVGRTAVFNISLYSSHSSTALAPEYGFVHFVWTFGKKEQPVLTYDYVMEHVFTTTGPYKVSVEAINPVSRTKDSSIIVVYASLTMVRVTFDNSHKSDPTMLTQDWREWFSHQLQRLLKKILHVNTDRLEVTVLPSLPTVVDVSVTPPKSNKSLATDEVVKSLKEAVDRGKVVITLPKAGSVSAIYAEEIYKIVPSATIIPGQTSPGGTDNRLAIAVGVAAGLLLIFVGLLVFYFYRRYRKLELRYIRLRQQDQDPLLQDTDQDDDEVEIREQRPGSMRYIPLREADLQETDDELLNDLHTGPLVVMNNGFNERGTAVNTQNAVST